MVKAEEIYPTEAFARMPFADGIVLRTKEGPAAQPNEWAWEYHESKGCLPYLRVTETHGDSVVTLPADTQVLAISDSTVNEVFLTGRNMLAFQSHPEFTFEEQLIHKVIPYVYPERMDDDERIAADESFSKPLHSDALVEVTRRFLKQDYHETVNMFIPGMGGPDEVEEGIEGGIEKIIHPTAEVTGEKEETTLRTKLDDLREFMMNLLGGHSTPIDGGSEHNITPVTTPLPTIDTSTTTTVMDESQFTQDNKPIVIPTSPKEEEEEYGAEGLPSLEEEANLPEHVLARFRSYIPDEFPSE